MASIDLDILEQGWTSGDGTPTGMPSADYGGAGPLSNPNTDLYFAFYLADTNTLMMGGFDR